MFGFNFTPMYNLNYKLRLGVSLDGTFDGGANLYTDGDVYGSVDKSDIVRPPLGDQFALGAFRAGGVRDALFCRRSWDRGERDREE